MILDTGFWPPARKAYASERYWMFLDFIAGAFLNIQHQASRIQHQPRKRDGLAWTLLSFGMQFYAMLG